MDQMHPSDRTYRSQTVRLSDLAVTDDVITGVTFENCIIMGPAVVVFQGCTITNSTFDGNEEGLVWDIGDRQFLLGVIGLVECTVVGCRLQRIGVAVPGPAREEFVSQLGFRD